MTTEEALKIITYKRESALPIPEFYKKNARIIAEIISVLQRENLNYSSASDLLKQCETVLQRVAKI